MSKNPAAVALGSITSSKKAAASRENGKKGGRPKEQQFMTSANMLKETATIRYEDENGPEWWVCHGDGEIELFDTASHALRAIQRRAKRIVEVTRTSAAVITTVQWMNTPQGFKPPTA